MHSILSGEPREMAEGKYLRWKWIIIRLQRCGLNSIGSGQVKDVGCCERGNEPWDSMKAGNLLIRWAPLGFPIKISLHSRHQIVQHHWASSTLARFQVVTAVNYQIARRNFPKDNHLSNTLSTLLIVVIGSPSMTFRTGSKKRLLKTKAAISGAVHCMKVLLLCCSSSSCALVNVRPWLELPKAGSNA